MLKEISSVKKKIKKIGKKNIIEESSKYVAIKGVALFLFLFFFFLLNNFTKYFAKIQFLLVWLVIRINLFCLSQSDIGK